MDVEGKSGSWQAIFGELSAAESVLEAAISNLQRSLDESAACASKPNSETWRNLHAQVSKSGRSLEKTYPGCDFSNNFTAGSQGNTKLWRDALGETLLREGYPLEEGFGGSVPAQHNAYHQLSVLLKVFSSDIERVFLWTKAEFPPGEHKEALLVLFIQLLFFRQLRAGNFPDALHLIRQNAADIHSRKHQKTIGRLLTASLFAGPSPLGAAGLLEEPSLEAVKSAFVRAYCSMANIPSADPLTICAEVGLRSMPTVDRVNSLLKTKAAVTLTASDELPIEIQLESDQLFHSVFSCPVTKQQSTDTNPPYLLPCSHALSKEALQRLSKGNSLIRFKCPYCPNESTFAQCVQLHF